MRFILATALKDLRRLRRDPASVLAGIGIPLIITAVLALVFSPGARPRGKLLIIDRDGSLVSRLLTSAFEQPALRDIVITERIDSENRARERLNRDDASAALVIPAGLGAAYFSGKPSRVALITNPAQRILPGIIEQTVAAVLDVANHPETRGGAQPRLLQLDTRIAGGKNTRDINIGALFFPGMLFVSILFVSQALSVDIWKEDASGTIRRFAVSPRPIEFFIAGRVLAAALVLLGVSAAGLVCARLALDLPVANMGAAIAWATFCAVSLFVLLLLLSLCASSESASRVLLTMVLFIFGMVGGSFFPFEMMPSWLAAIGHWTPNGLAITNFKAILDGSETTPRLSIAIAGFSAAAIAAFFASAWRVRRAFLR